MQKPLPAQPSLEQFKKQAKELVKNHRNHSAEAFALIREFLPSLSSKNDEEMILYPFALHDAQSVIARQYGFPSWKQLRDRLELDLNRLKPDSAVEAKFQTICASRKLKDFTMYCSVMNESMRTAVSRDDFETSVLGAYFETEYTSTYMGEMIEGERAVHFWRVSTPGVKSDLRVRMGIKNDLVSGLLFSGPFGAFDSSLKKKMKSPG